MVNKMVELSQELMDNSNQIKEIGWKRNLSVLVYWALWILLVVSVYEWGTINSNSSSLQTGDFWSLLFFFSPFVLGIVLPVWTIRWMRSGEKRSFWVLLMFILALVIFTYAR